MNTRAIACEYILDILAKKNTLLTLDKKLKKLDLDSQDSSFIKALCYDFFRNYFSLEKIVNKYISNKTKINVKILIMLGTLQLLEMSQPNYAAINETVNACKKLKITWATKLVNAILRQILRDFEIVKRDFLEYKKTDLPEWLCSKIKSQYPNDYQEILIQSNKKAPMFIRLNNQKNKQEVMNFLNQNNISFQQTSLTDCIRLDTPLSVENNDLFNKGYFTIQDISAQYAGHIINPHNEERILDACAAPGGKTTHLLEINPNIYLTAIDIIDSRLQLLKDNISRASNSKVEIKKHDLTQKLSGSFDKIILDAPCSAIGVIRRNPDIKISRSSEDVKNILGIQSRILQNLWGNLKPNGYLLYITCSILEEENEKQIENFLQLTPDAQIENINILSEYKRKFGYQILPSENQGDGFYYCLIHRV
ncbi:16S rRNA (cytosine(967)-C(5))-methyltransferase RsmB [Francisella frigiditurris]|uniref:16S rRNA (cytosine(967)-C(5))-methyltransferase n=1 Tax=Francisella frigiditurris TaxID=1542390 RepID=A0A1J0KTG0_9GAMM|nr:16S rRNA (cytosine(967)-C(5))-methyltransferase RsmB [Francisella frigiditurris]APC97064.1 16S rRNA (cytosine(967)-C(5))-methyltransferase [Francisella frigiditurris]